MPVAMVLSALFLAGCFDACGEAAENNQVSFEIEGPTEVVAGEPATFTVDGVDLIDEKEGVDSCPVQLDWYFEGADTPNPSVKPPKTRVENRFSSEGLPRAECVLDNERRAYAFPAGEPDTERTVEVSVDVIQDLIHTGAGTKTVTVVTPANAPAPGPSPSPDPGPSPGPGTAAPSFAPTQVYGDVGQHPVGVEVTELSLPGGAPGRSDVTVLDNEDDPTDDDVALSYATQADGSLASLPSVTFLGAGADPRDIASADLDSDGDRDLVVANTIEGNGSANDQIQVLTNDGAGSFATTSYTVTRSPEAIATGDVNGDNVPDVVTVSSADPAAPGDDVASVFVNTGTGLLQSPQNIATGGSFPLGVEVVDLNADGRRDLAIANAESGTTTILRNTTGSGSVAFAAAETLPQGGSTRFPHSVSSADFNADGKPDLAVANAGTSTVSVLTNGTAAGAGSFSFIEQLPASGDTPVRIAAGDFNGDGAPDLATANAGDDSATVLTNTAGAFGGPLSLAMGLNVRDIGAGALNADGRSDLAVASFGSPAPPPRGDLRVALSQVPAESAAPTLLAAKALTLRGVGGFSRIDPVDLGVTSPAANGEIKVKGMLVRAKLHAKLAGSKKTLKRVPKALKKSLNGTVLARLDGTAYPSADVTAIRPFSGVGTVAGQAGKGGKLKSCLRVRFDSRVGVGKANSFKLLGGTGPLRKLQASGMLPPIEFDGVVERGSVRLKVKPTKVKKKLPSACRKLLKKL